MASGRPKEYDLDEIAKELLKWSSLESSIRLQDFTKDKTYCTQQLIEWNKKNPDTEFSLSYRMTLDAMASRREQMANTGTIAKHVYNLTAPVYDKVLDEHQRDRIKYDAEVKKEIEDLTAPVKVSVIDYAKAT